MQNDQLNNNENISIESVFQVKDTPIVPIEQENFEPNDLNNNIVNDFIPQFDNKNDMIQEEKNVSDVVNQTQPEQNNLQDIINNINPEEILNNSVVESITNNTNVQEQLIIDNQNVNVISAFDVIQENTETNFNNDNFPADNNMVTSVPETPVTNNDNIVNTIEANNNVVLDNQQVEIQNNVVEQQVQEPIPTVEQNNIALENTDNVVQQPENMNQNIEFIPNNVPVNDSNILNNPSDNNIVNTIEANNNIVLDNQQVEIQNNIVEQQVQEPIPTVEQNNIVLENANNIEPIPNNITLEESNIQNSNAQEQAIVENPNPTTFENVLNNNVEPTIEINNIPSDVVDMNSVGIQNINNQPEIQLQPQIVQQVQEQNLQQQVQIQSQEQPQNIQPLAQLQPEIKPVQNNIPEKKESNLIFYIIILFLVIVIGCIIGYLLYF